MTRHEDIERFLSGEMPADERAAFEKELQTDQVLREETEHYASTMESLRRTLHSSEEERSLRGKLEQRRGHYFSGEEHFPEEEHFPGEAKKREPKIRVLPLMRWAAAAAVLAVVWIWSPWNNDPLREYGSITMPSPVERGADSAGGLSDAVSLFNDQEYEQALPLLQEELRGQPGDMYLLFFRGVTLLHTGKTEPARADLRKVFESKSIYRFDAAYFIGLSYLTEEDEETCRDWLEKIPPDTQTGRKAQELMEKLK